MKKMFKNLFAFMFVLMSGLVLTACGTENFDVDKIKVGETTFTYDGYTHVCEIDYEVADVKVSVTYSETQDGQFKPAEDLTFIGAGEYSVYYKLSAIGFNDYVSPEAVTFTVNPKEITLNVEDVEIVRSNMGDTAPPINPTHTTPGVLTGDSLGLSFSIGDKVGTVNTPFNATTAVVGDEYFIEATSTNGNYKIVLNDAKVKIIDAVEVIGQSGSTYFSDLPTAVSVNTNGASIKLHSDVVLINKVFINNGKEYTIDLNGYNVSFPSDTNGEGIFHVENAGSKLTINDSVGTAVVDSTSQANDYSMAVWANLGGEVVINGGTFTNVGGDDWDDAHDEPNNTELIYASRGSTITIKDGAFIGNYQNETWGTRYALNLKDKSASVAESFIIVEGGRFLAFNPKESLSENPKADFAPNCTVRTENSEVVYQGTTLVWYIAELVEA